MTQEAKTETDHALLILHDIGRTFGFIPNLFQTYAKYPPLLEANWNKVRLLLLHGKIKRLPKEVIALLVSHDNGCSYCVAAHGAALRSMGMQDQQIADMVRGELAAHLSKRDVALVRFVRQANQRNHDIQRQDFDNLIATGYTEAEIIEALGVMELFAGFNRFAKVMHIDVDF